MSSRYLDGLISTLTSSMVALAKTQLAEDEGLRLA